MTRIYNSRAITALAARILAASLMVALVVFSQGTAFAQEDSAGDNPPNLDEVALPADPGFDAFYYGLPGTNSGVCELSGVCERFGGNAAKYFGFLEYFYGRVGLKYGLLFPHEYDPQNDCVRRLIPDEEIPLCEGVERPTPQKLTGMDPLPVEGPFTP